MFYVLFNLESSSADLLQFVNYETAVLDFYAGYKCKRNFVILLLKSKTKATALMACG